MEVRLRLLQRLLLLLRPRGPLPLLVRPAFQAAIAATLLLALTITLCVVSYQRNADARRADALMLRAAACADGGEFTQAISLTNDALRLRNDDITRERYPCNWPKGAHAFGVRSAKPFWL